MKGTRKGQTAGSGTVTITLDAGVAQDLYQALTLALGAGGTKSAALGKKTRPRYGKGKSASLGKTPPRKAKPKGKR